MKARFGQNPLPVYPDHAELDLASAEIVAQAAANPVVKWWTQDMASNRADYAAMIAQVGLQPSGLVDRTVIEIATPAGNMLPLHLYRPRDCQLRCTIVFLRGSGMCMGSMELYHGILERLCACTEALIAAPEYRLAPEHPFPAGHDDSYTAFSWVVRDISALGGNSDRLVVAGDSAGGMLAAATCARARREHPGAIALQVLIAPALGTHPLSFSVQRYARGFLLDVEDLAWLYSTYLAGDDHSTDPSVFPIHMSDLTGMPPTLMITAGADIMRDDAEAFLRRLHNAGVAVEHTRFAHTIHPFLNLGGAIPACTDAIDRVAETLRRLFP
jgi:acetyl esterase